MTKCSKLVMLSKKLLTTNFDNNYCLYATKLSANLTFLLDLIILSQAIWFLYSNDMASTKANAEICAKLFLKLALFTQYFSQKTSLYFKLVFSPSFHF